MSASSPGGLRRIASTLRRDGPRGLAVAVRRRLRERSLDHLSADEQYRRWLHRHVLTRPAPAASGRRFRVLVVGASGDRALDGTRESLRGSGARAEVVIWNAGSEPPPSGGADYVTAAAAGDRFAPGALDELARAADSDGRDVLYGDEDVAGADGRRRPALKPAWSPLLSVTLPGIYPGSPTAIAGAVWDSVRSEARGPAAWTDATLRSLEAASRVTHVPVPLLTRIEGPDPLLGDPAARLAAAAEAAERRGWGRLVPGPRPGTARLAVPPAPSFPRISVIVPTRDQPDLLIPLGSHLEARARELPLELVFVDHRSVDPRARDYLEGLRKSGRARVLREEGPFNYARMMCRGVRESGGDLVLLLNNDVEPLAEDWIEALARATLLPGAAAAGALLLYPDGTIQHGGVALGVGTVAGHLHKGTPVSGARPWIPPDVAREVSAVTGACLMVRREEWDAVGGMDDDRLAVSYNDVDLCMKLSARGRRILYEPAARLIHHETVSRPREVDPAEVRTMRERWTSRLRADPYCSPALYRGSDRPGLELWEPGPLRARSARADGCPV